MILANLHVSFGFALVGAVVGEFLGSRPGIVAAMMVLTVVALAGDYLLTRLEKRLLNGGRILNCLS